MTQSFIELSVTAEDRQIARLTAAAVLLAVVDAAIPLPLPGVKPGLANIVVLLVLYRYGFAAAAWVSLLRVLVAAFLFGQLLAPGFFLSAAGALASLFALRLGSFLPRRAFGPVSLSLAAAFAHICGQMLLVRLWLIPHDHVFLLLPVFFAAALVSGTVNGLAVAVCLRESAAGAEISRNSRIARHAS